MEGFEWAQNNLRVDDPQALQGQGVNVYFAPNIEPDRKVVNLANGQVTIFQPEEARPLTGYYADYEGLIRFCRQADLPFSETNGQISVLPYGHDEAGDPLHRVGE